MRKIYNIIKSATLLAAIAFTTASCQDWLTIYPQDKVVEDEFWADKSDLEGVRYSAYRSMTKSMSKFYLWGDLRSDLYILNPSEPDNNNARTTRLRYQKIIQAMPDSSMAEFDWAGVYTTIGYCNKVLYNGPKVLERDKQFTNTEWKQMRAEMVGLRALNYFYLLRAFKDIPYTKKVINADVDVEYFPLTNQLAVLDSCIVDLEGNPANPNDSIHPGVLGQARTRFPQTQDSKGLITNSALYVMLADMYLWRASLWQGRLGDKITGVGVSSDMVIGTDTIAHTPETDYQAAAQYADLALAALKKQNDEEFKGYGTTSALIEDYNLKDYGIENAELMDNEFKKVKFANMNNVDLEIPVINAMYTKGNCRESILEIQVNSSDGNTNDIVNSLFTKSSSNQLAVSEEALKAAFKDVKTMDMDSRVLTGGYNRISSMSSSSSVIQAASQVSPGRYCLKFAAPKAHLKAEGEKQVTIGYSSSKYRNFIIYRMSDAILIKAEAAAVLEQKNKKLQGVDVEKICNALRRRAYMPYMADADVQEHSTNLAASQGYDANKTGKLSAGAASLVELVMNERMLEFVGEGKRWFDLVRFAERNASLPNSGFGTYKFTGIDGNDEREVTQKCLDCSYQVMSVDTLAQCPVCGGTSFEQTYVKDGSRGVSYMIQKYVGVTQNSYVNTLINRMKNRYGLYCPIYEMEVKAAKGTIEQNPVWNKSKYDR